MAANRDIAPAPGPWHPVPAPRLLVPWPRWDEVFLDNLADLLLGSGPPARISARPAEFWPDVFVAAGLPWRNLLRSALYHLFFVVALWGFSVTWLQRPQVATRSPFENSKLTYYSVSEYLPEINTGETEPPRERHGQPAYAKQKILSLPPAHDNSRQTLITPSNIKLPREAPLPNLVAWTPIPTPIPEAALNHARLTAPPVPAVSPVAPPPDPMQASERLHALPAPEVVEPAANPDSVRARVRLPHVPGPAVVGPPPSVETATGKVNVPELPTPAVVGPPVGGNAVRNIGAMSIAHADIAVTAPRLPVAEQRPAVIIHPGTGRHGSGGNAGAGAAPPPSVVAGAGNGQQDIGQLIALSVNPAPVRGPIMVPAGTRHGEFAAGPEGMPGAPGTPDIHGGTGNGDGNGHGATVGPPGISVAPGPSPVPPGVVVAGNPAAAPEPAAPAKTSPPLLASIRPIPVADLARATHPGSPIPAPEPLDAKIFGTRKYYSMILNMPNMTSAGGSWIIRFAELHQTNGDLVAPVATLKVDPAYPPELIRHGLEGTVTVYAVIRRDGSVGQVRVLRGFDSTLDENACIAVSRWHFRPATKNGQAVDLEAVFHVPFIAHRPAF